MDTTAFPALLQFGAMGVLAATLYYVLRFMTERISTTAEFTQEIAKQSIVQMQVLVAQNQEAMSQHTAALQTIADKMENLGNDHEQLREDHRKIIGR